ncbi:hypothetical protein LWI28_012038 [Acer negundo]|uniref:Uncharacterized protein n=1 Tax=Acer negundo TaxID=4023 RepID=A0AAD5IDT1_ACENE|nr:hypothetical protein LWI28_012038 [Acer negundo]
MDEMEIDNSSEVVDIYEEYSPESVELSSKEDTYEEYSPETHEIVEVFFFNFSKHFLYHFAKMSDNPNAEWDYDYGGEDSSLEKSSISFKKRRNGGDSITEGSRDAPRP